MKELMLSGIFDGTAFTIRPARMAKGMLAVRHESADIYKARGSFLADALKARWTGRDKAYLMTPAKADLWLDLMRKGYTGCSFGDYVYHESATLQKFTVRRGKLVPKNKV